MQQEWSRGDASGPVREKFPYTELIPVASERSIGKKVECGSNFHEVVGLETAVSMKPDVALFSAGGSTSLEWAPKFAEAGTVVIDNSSAWRMDPTKKLIIPEINANQLTSSDKIIANPNCSTIQMLMALAPLQDHYGIERIVVSTYQSITGTGVKAVQQLENEYKEEKEKWLTLTPFTVMLFPIVMFLWIMATPKRK